MLETLRVHCLSEQASCMDSGNSKNKREHNHSEKESKHNIILLSYYIIQTKQARKNKAPVGAQQKIQT